MLGRGRLRRRLCLRSLPYRLGSDSGHRHPADRGFATGEEATQEAFGAAVSRWRADGVPEHPQAWIIRTARNIAIDRIRRNKVLAGKLESYAADLDASAPEPELPFEIPDDRLRLIFTCCHPALALEAQVALTLRTLVGLETGEIARAFLVPVPTMAQRLVRAKRSRSPSRRAKSRRCSR